MIAKCPKCSNEFDNAGKWSVLKYCSRRCANSRRQTEQQNESRRRKMKANPPTKQFTKEQWNEIGRKGSETKLSILTESDFDDLSFERKKRRIMLEQRGKCSNCGIDEWRDKPINLAVDHVDGNRKNNCRSNLRGLCPNCHSQTETFCGRNRPTRVSDEVLIQALMEHKTIRGALDSLGKGANHYNYTRCRKLMVSLL